MNTTNPLAYALRLQAQVTELAKIQQLLGLFAPINTNNPLSSNFQENFATSSSHVITNNVPTNTQFLVNSYGTIPNLDNSTSSISNSSELSNYQSELNSKMDNFEGLINQDYVINQDYDPNAVSQLNHEGIEGSFWNDIFQ